MTVVVLGMDALESSLVEDLDLKYLRQKKWCELELDDYPVLSSPIIWSSMLTGEIVPDLANEFGWGPVKPGSRLHSLLKLISHKKLRKAFDLAVRGFKEDAPYIRTSSYLSQNDIPTIFEEVRSWFDGVPGYDYEPFEKEFSWKEVLTDSEAREEAIKKLDALHRERVSRLKEALKIKEKYELIFYFDEWLDKAGHLTFWRKHRMVPRYLDMNQLVKKVKGFLDAEDKVYVISDHGMGTLGDHTERGFFSSNTGELIQKPFELYSLLKS